MPTHGIFLLPTLLANFVLNGTSLAKIKSSMKRVDHIANPLIIPNTPTPIKIWKIP
ncbi:hypothetical protein IKD48_01845 [bacterium]|nr:hypothetical protein [bacterium]